MTGQGEKFPCRLKRVLSTHELSTRLRTCPEWCVALISPLVVIVFTLISSSVPLA